MDLLGQILWYGMFCTPLIIIPIVWKSERKWTSILLGILLGILLAGILSLMLYVLSLSIIFRDGMGPG